MAWVGDHIFSYAQGYVVGLVVNCPESAATVMTDLREIGPTYYFAPPRVLENLITQVDDPHGGCGLHQAPAVPVFHGARPHASARRCSTAGRSSPLDRLLYRAGQRCWSTGRSRTRSA